MSSTVSKQEKIDKLKAWMLGTFIDKDVTSQTLNGDFSHISPAMFLASSKKLIQVNRKEVPPDDRDNLKFSTFHGIEDFLEEHIDKDAGKVQKKAAMKMRQKKNLSWLNPSFFTHQLRSVVIGNSLATNVEGINPLEHFDNSHRVTKLGQGGIPSTQAVPDESRNVNSSSFGFIDPLHISENENVGVTGYLAQDVVKGKDKKLYRVMLDKTGKKVWVDHEKILNSKVLIPEN